MSDSALENAIAQVSDAQKGVPIIRAFFDKPTFTVSYVVHDPETKKAAIIDSVLDFDPASGPDLVRVGGCHYRICCTAGLGR